MSRVCTVCHAPERHAIDAALVRGDPNRRIAARFGLTEQAVRRHAAAHLPALLVRAQEAEEMADADDLLEQVNSLHRRTLVILGQAEVAGEHRMALAAIREARGNLELLGRLMGELQDHAPQPLVSVLLAADWPQVYGALVAALRPHPEALEAVSTALEYLERAQPDGRSRYP